MKDIKCPSCGKTFKIDPSSFDELLSQIKNEEFARQIDSRLKLAEKEKFQEIELIKSELRLEMILTSLRFLNSARTSCRSVRTCYKMNTCVG